MRVIGLDKTVERKATCSSCGSILAYLKVDVKVSHYTDISGCGDSTYWIQCPMCNEHVTVKSWW